MSDKFLELFIEKTFYNELFNKLNLTSTFIEMK